MKSRGTRRVTWISAQGVQLERVSDERGTNVDRWSWFILRCARGDGFVVLLYHDAEPAKEV